MLPSELDNDNKMNNKQHGLSFFGKLHQLFRKKNLLLILPLSLGVLLTACEKEESDREQARQIEFLRPYNSDVVNVDQEEDFIIALNSFVNAGSEPTQIDINDIPCYRYPHALDAGACSIVYSKTSNTIKGEFANLRQVLVQGENKVTIKNIGRNSQETLYFTYDNQKPRLEVKSIKPIAQQQPPAQLNASDPVDITFTINDASEIKSVRFNVGGVQQYPVFTYKTEMDAYQDQGLQTWQDEQAAYKNDLKNKEFTVKNIKWPSADSVAPQFTYTVVDVHGNKNEGSFSVNGTKLVNSQAIQLNNTFFQQIAPVANELIRAAVGVVEDNIFRNNDYSDTMQLCFGSPSGEIEGAICSANQMLTSTFCAPSKRFPEGLLGWGANCGAFVHVDRIKIVKPRVTTSGNQSGTFDVKLGVAFAEISVPFTVEGPGNNKFTSRLSLTDFELYSLFALQKAKGKSDLIDYKRSRVSIYFIPDFFGNKQMYLRDSWCHGTCGPVSGLIEPVYNLGLTKQGDTISKRIADAVEKAIGGIIPPETAAPIAMPEEASFIKFLMGAPQHISRITNSQAHWFNKSPRNGHFSFNHEAESSLALEEKAGLVTVAEPKLALGLQLNNKNSYGYVKNANFPSKEPGVEGSRIDFAYAISQDNVNQMLLNAYQEDDNAQVIALDAPDANKPFFDDAQTVCMQVKANKAPTVQFYGYYSQKVSVGVGFTDKIAENAAKEKAQQWKQLCQAEYGENAQECAGIEHDYESVTLLDTSKETVPGSIKLIMENVELSAKKLDSTAEVCAVNNTEWGPVEPIPVDIEVRVFVTMENGKPIIKPYNREDDNFVLVRAKSVQHSAIAANYHDVIKAHVNKELDKFNQPEALLAKEPVSPRQKGDIALKELPGLKEIFELPIPGMPGFDVEYVASNYISDSWKVRYGVKFISFGIEPSGAYFRATGKVDSKVVSGACSDNDYFRYFCVMN